ncbi:MAG: hypothetical protein OK454_08710 [Thaumarchaeota archaeon]|nr:hypothetical protein [Nitrososphaerota archaeon]
MAERFPHLDRYEHGFYWVRLGSGWKTHGAWVVAECEARGWQVVDEHAYYQDTEFDEIRLPRLKAPDEL